MNIISMLLGKTGKAGTTPACEPLAAPFVRSSFVSSLGGLRAKGLQPIGESFPKVGGGEAPVADSPATPRQQAAALARKQLQALRMACFKAISPMRKSALLARKTAEKAKPLQIVTGYRRQPDLMQEVSIRPPSQPSRPKMAPPCKANLEDDQDETELMKASPYRAARLRERARIMAIIQAAEAKGRREAAAYLAFHTNTGRFSAIRLLANMPAGAAIEMDRDPYPRGIAYREMGRRGGL